MLHGIISKQRSVQNVCLETKEKIRSREKQIKGLAATATKVHRQKRKDGKDPAITTAQRRNIPPAQPAHQPKKAAAVLKEENGSSELTEEQIEELLPNSSQLRVERDEKQEENISLERRSACSTPLQSREITEDSKDEDWDFCS